MYALYLLNDKQKLILNNLKNENSDFFGILIIVILSSTNIKKKIKSKFNIMKTNNFNNDILWKYKIEIFYYFKNIFYVIEQ